jgi:putative Ca2+/H+ antiporter (TMEM165/GDT1 family)
MPNPNSWTTKLTLLLASSLTVMSGATVAPSLPAMKQQFESALVIVALGFAIFKSQVRNLTRIRAN